MGIIRGKEYNIFGRIFENIPNQLGKENIIQRSQCKGRRHRKRSLLEIIAAFLCQTLGCLLQSCDFLQMHLCLLLTWGGRHYVDSFTFGPCCQVLPPFFSYVQFCKKMLCHNYTFLNFR